MTPDKTGNQLIMGQTITLGGERLHSGNRNKVHLDGFARSTMNLSRSWLSTMAPGTIVPFYHNIGLPGDTWDIDNTVEVKTYPTTGPLYGSFTLYIEWFRVPIRLYVAPLNNNMVNVGREMDKIKFPTITMTAPEFNGLPNDLDNCQINPSSIMKYLGLSGIGSVDSGGATNRVFNGTMILAYWDIVKNFYTNKQEELAAVIHTETQAIVQTIDSIEVDGNTVTKIPPGTVGNSVQLNPPMQITVNYTGTAPIGNQILLKFAAGPFTQNLTRALDDIAELQDDSGTVQTWVVNPTRLPGTMYIQYWYYRSVNDLPKIEPSVVLFDIANLDQIRTDLLAHPMATPFDITTEAGYAPFSWINGAANGVPYMMNAQEGLAVCCYKSDLFNNWLNNEWIGGANGINELSRVDVSGGYLTMDALNVAMKVYDVLNKIAAADGSYKAYIETAYDHFPSWQCTTPMYEGGVIKPILFQEIISNSGTDSNQSSQPLGTLAGRGIDAGSQKGGRTIIKVDEPSIIMGIARIVPNIVYSQGNRYTLHLMTMADLHIPGYDQIGFEDLIEEQMAWWSTNWDGTSFVQRSAGKQPAWMNYRTDITEVYGNFAVETDSMFMVLTRRYESTATASSMANIQIKDLTTYIDPAKFNHIFAQASRDAQNFWVNIGSKIECRRKMSAKIMPNL